VYLFIHSKKPRLFGYKSLICDGELYLPNFYCYAVGNNGNCIVRLQLRRVVMHSELCLLEWQLVISLLCHVKWHVPQKLCTINWVLASGVEEKLFITDVQEISARYRT